MATEREVYQIVLQLKDELSSHLNQVNTSLNRTREAGQRTAEGVEGFSHKIKSAIQPIRDFSRAMSSLLAAGGLVALFMRVANAAGDMEKAYAKLYPESQKAVGSLTSWNEIMAHVKADQGNIVSTLLTPIRQAFLDMIDPIASATWEMDQLKKKMEEIINKYMTPEKKALKERKDALNYLAESQRDYNLALKEYETAQININKAKADLSKFAKQTEAGGYSVEQLRLRADLEKIYRLEVEKWEAAQFSAGQAMQAALREQATLKDWLVKDAEKQGSKEKVITQELQKQVDLAYLLDEHWRVPTREEEAAIGNEPYQITPEQEALALIALKIEMQKQVIALRKEEYLEGIKLNNGEKERLELEKVKTEELEKQLQVIRDQFREFAMATLQTVIIGVADAMGQAVAGAQAFEEAMRNLAQTVLKSLGTFMIQKGLELLPTPAGFALLAAGGLFLVGGGAMGARQSQGIQNPAAMASGGIVTRPTLALLGESGAEAVVPLTNPYRGRAGGAGIGGITINAPNARYLDARTAGQLVRLGLVAMRS